MNPVDILQSKYKTKPIMSHIGYFISKLTYQSPGSQVQDSTKRQEAEVNKINITP